MRNFVDNQIAYFFNQFVHRTPVVDALVYTTLFFAVPRLWLGFHFLTVELAGAAIGCLSAWVGYIYLICTKLVARLVAFSEDKPQYFYPLLVLFSGQLYEMFESARNLISILRWGIKVLIIQ